METPRYKLKTAPTFDPITLDQLKRNLHIESDNHDQDEYLQEIINSVIENVQSNIGRQIARATYTAYLDDFPSEDLRITLGPVYQISSVKYYNSSDVLTTMSSAKYLLDNTELTGRLRFIETYTVYGNRLNGVEIEFTNGWADAASVPKDLRDALILLASDRYLNPENAMMNFGMSIKQNAAEHILRNYRVQRF
jgi:uncharacterized phiE125 gp8 family phage protein